MWGPARRGGGPLTSWPLHPPGFAQLQREWSKPTASGEGMTGREKNLLGAGTPVWHSESDPALPNPDLANTFLARARGPTQHRCPLFNTLHINQANTAPDLPGSHG